MPRHCSKRAAPFPRSLARAACATLLCALLAALPAASASADEAALAPGDPYGTRPQITDDGRLFAWLYLPGLPGHPQLEALRIERARADAPEEWEPVYTFVWDEGWQEYAALEDPLQTIRYYNYDTGDDTPCVDYFEAGGDRRSFHLRATADVVVDGAARTLSFAPVLFPLPGDEGAAGEQGESGGAADGGGSGGDKGGIGQGENERPDIEPPAILPSAGAAEGCADAQEPAAPPAAGNAEAGEAAAEPEESPATGEAPCEAGAPARSDASGASREAAPQPRSGHRAEAEEDAPARLPGAVFALAATAVLAAAVALAARLLHR